jgi:NAD(P)-dependent dehydrogenase (short-subunit alcohol dehydrogenase family)
MTILSVRNRRNEAGRSGTGLYYPGNSQVRSGTHINNILGMNELNFKDLKDKVCIITGGAGIIGTSIVHALASVGIKTAILDLNGKMAEELAKKISDQYGCICKGFAADVLDIESLKHAREEIHAQLGRINILINGAGGNSSKATTKVEQVTRDRLDKLEETFFGLPMEGFRDVFDLNFNGTVLPTMIFARDMVEAGSGVILNISSMNALKPLTKIPAYSAAKASVNNFTEWLAVHLAQAGVRVNAIAPGFFLTQQNRFLLVKEKTGDLTARGRKIIKSTPMGRFGETDELQGTVLYLLSDVSRFVTGVIIPVDGGFSAYGGV